MMGTNTTQFSLCILISLILHALLMVWFYCQPDHQVVLAKSSSVTINVGLQAAIAGANVPSTMHVATPNVAQSIEAHPETVVEKSVGTTLARQSRKDTVPVLKQQAKLPKSIVKKVVKKKHTHSERKKITERPLAQQLTVAGERGEQGVNGSAHDQTEKRETGVGHTAGGVVNEEQFDYYIRQHLLSKKAKPKVLIARHKKGRVVVEFTLDRDGHLLAYKIATSSRIREFDRAAIKLVHQAEPFPQAPDFVTWKTRQYKIDISYSVN